MRTIVITPPAAVVTFAEAAAHLRLGADTSEQTLVTAMIAAATASIDGPAGWLGRAIGEQELEARFDSFGCGELRLPYPEIIEVSSVVYVDSDGVETTIDDADYRLTGDIVSPVYGTSWPSPRSEREAVRVTYDAGYEAGAPPAIKAAILMMLGDMFSFRESAVIGTISSSIPVSATVEALLSPYRVYRL